MFNDKAIRFLQNLLSVSYLITISEEDEMDENIYISAYHHNNVKNDIYVNHFNAESDCIFGYI